MRYGGNVPASHCRGLGLVPGQSVRMCADEIALQQILRRVFRIYPITTRKTPTILRTRFHLYMNTSQKEQTKPEDNPTEIMLFSHIGEHEEWQVRRRAEKSLARPRRKQATSTKLGIYSTNSPRSSIHFLACCLTFASHSKKIGKLSVPPGPRGSNDLRVGRKTATFQLFFQSRKQVVIRRGQIRRIRWVIKTLEAQVGQSHLSCKCPVSWGIVEQEQDPLVNFPRRFSFKMSSNCTSRDESCSALTVRSFWR